MSEQARATGAVVDFISRARWPDFPAEAVALAKRCIIDGLGVMLAGSTTGGSTILRDYVARGATAARRRRRSAPQAVPDRRRVGGAAQRRRAATRWTSTTRSCRRAPIGSSAC